MTHPRSTGARSTSSASAAPGSRRTRTSRVRGGRRCGLGPPGDDLPGDAQGVDVDIGGEPTPPCGFEIVVSTAHAGRVRGPVTRRVPGRARALRRSIVIGGAHGKTTTAAIVAYVLERARRTIRPGSSAGSSRSSVATPETGRAGSSSRVTSRIARSSSCVPRSRSSRTSSSTIMPAYASTAELDDLLRGVAATAPKGFVAGSSRRSSSSSRSPAAQPTERSRRAGRSRARRSRAGGGEEAIVSFTGVGRRFELVGERGGVRVVDDYGHNPTEIAAPLRGRARWHRAPPHRRLPAARPRADAPASRRARRSARARGRGDRHRRDRRSRRARPASQASWCSTTCRRASGEAGRRRSRMRRRSRSRGRGRETWSSRSAWGSRGGSRERSSTGCLSDEASRHGVDARALTTIGTGGPARALARPRTVPELEDALRSRAGKGSRSSS